MLQLRSSAWLRPVLTLLSLAGLLSLAACGGGGGSPYNLANPPTTTVPGLSVIPANGVAYSGFPITLTIVSGTGPFVVTSNNPAILPVPPTVSGPDIVPLRDSQ